MLIGGRVIHFAQGFQIRQPGKEFHLTKKFYVPLLEEGNLSLLEVLAQSLPQLFSGTLFPLFLEAAPLKMVFLFFSRVTEQLSFRRLKRTERRRGRERGREREREVSGGKASRLCPAPINPLFLRLFWPLVFVLIMLSFNF